VNTTDDQKVEAVELFNHSNLSNFLLKPLKVNIEVHNDVFNYFVQYFRDGRIVVLTNIPLSLIKPFGFVNELRIFNVFVDGPDYS